MLKKCLWSCTFLLLYSPFTPIYASERDGSVPITLYIANSQTYLLVVKVVGKGTIYDGSQKIQEQVNMYSLEIGEIKTFDIESDEGYVVEKITLNGVEITKQRKIEVIGKQEEQELIAYFIKDGKTVIETSDKSEIEKWVGMLGITMIAVVILIKRGRKNGNKHIYISK